MPKVCAVTGKKTRFQKTSKRRGSPKKKGGVGLKKSGVHSRTISPISRKRPFGWTANPIECGCLPKPYASLTRRC